MFQKNHTEIDWNSIQLWTILSMGNRKYHIASCWWISSSEKCNTLWSVMIIQQQNHRTWRTSRFDSADRKRAGSWRSVSKRDDEKMRERYVKHFKCVGALIDTNCIDVQTANLNCETRTLFWGRYLLFNTSVRYCLTERTVGQQNWGFFAHCAAEALFQPNIVNLTKRHLKKSVQLILVRIQVGFPGNWTD